MAAIDTIHPQSGFGLTHLVTAVLGYLDKRRQAHLTRQSLSLLSDRELDDVGLLRCEIDEVAANVVR